jgi:N-acetylglucosaminyldiphosphoundecaprenol N-acetyl-beta-D-mannosaminyltransferase
MSAQAISQGVIRHRFLAAPFDTVAGDVLGVLTDPRPGFRYVVTPNVDHVVRIAKETDLRRIYESAAFSICDSKPILALAWLMGLELTYLPGANLTDRLFRTVLSRPGRIALVAPSEEIAAAVAAAHPHLDAVWMVPPPGTSTDARAFQDCVEFVATASADFTFIAIGSPTSERIAYAASLDRRSMGVALCIGAALEFLVGEKRRAPVWIQAIGAEWLFRLASEPRRLWRRYLYGFVPLIRLFATELRARRAGLPTVDANG